MLEYCNFFVDRQILYAVASLYIIDTLKNTEGIIRILIYQIDKTGVISQKVVHNSPEMCRIGYTVACDFKIIYFVGG
jgi:hypothetical protein